MQESPRILLTGFSSFPGVPANPTEALIDALRADPGLLAGVRTVHPAVLPVEYRALPGLLEALGRDVRPDIALHFGVSRRATAFVIEMTARNAVCTVRPDNAGHVPAESWVREGGNEVASTLPATAIRDALAGSGLPAVFSDDAGDYLCNSLFYLSAGRRCPPFAAAQAGFIHVPPFGTLLDGSSGMFELPTLVQGATTICRICRDVWVADKQKAAELPRAAF